MEFRRGTFYAPAFFFIKMSDTTPFRVKFPVHRRARLLIWTKMYNFDCRWCNYLIITYPQSELSHELMLYF